MLLKLESKVTQVVPIFFFFNVSFKEKSLCPPERRLTTDSQRLGGCVQGRNNCRKIERQLLKSHGVLTTGRFDEGGPQASRDPGGTQNPLESNANPGLHFLGYTKKWM